MADTTATENIEDTAGANPANQNASVTQAGFPGLNADEKALFEASAAAVHKTNAALA